MKPAFAMVASVAVVAIAGCAGVSRAGGDNGAARLPSSHSVLAVERLRSMPSATGFDALKTMPAYFARAHQLPAPRFVLVLDGTRTSDLEMLKTILARDLFEIRVVGDNQSIASAGDVEVIVSTLGGRKRP